MHASILLIVATLFSFVVAARADDVLNLSAAISLKASLEEARPALEKTAGLKIAFNYGASGALAAQIRNGAPVDLFISADHETVDALAEKKLVDITTRTVIAGNQIVLVVPAENTAVPIRSFDDLKQPAVKRIAMGEPKTVPAGRYAKQTLENLKLYDDLSAAKKLATGENVAQVLAFVARGEVDAGLVYSSDAFGNKKVRLVAPAPPNSHEPILYVAAVVTNSGHSNQARAVLKSLTQSDIQSTLAHHGFTAPIAEPPTSTPAK